VPNRDEEAGSSQERRGQIIFGCLYPILLEDYNHAVNTIVHFSSSYLSRFTVGLNVYLIFWGDRKVPGCM
jgi:hypothetical protein